MTMMMMMMMMMTRTILLYTGQELQDSGETLAMYDVEKSRSQRRSPLDHLEMAG